MQPVMHPANMQNYKFKIFIFLATQNDEIVDLTIANNAYFQNSKEYHIFFFVYPILIRENSHRDLHSYRIY
jgi:hypothetical protein